MTKDLATTIQAMPGNFGTVVLPLLLAVIVLAGTIESRDGAEPAETPEVAESPNCEKEPRLCLVCFGRHHKDESGALPCGH